MLSLCTDIHLLDRASQVSACHIFAQLIHRSSQVLPARALERIVCCFGLLLFCAAMAACASNQMYMCAIDHLVRQGVQGLECPSHVSTLPLPLGHGQLIARIPVPKLRLEVCIAPVLEVSQVGLYVQSPGVLRDLVSCPTC